MVIIRWTRKISWAALHPAINTPFTASPTLSNCQHFARVREVVHVHGMPLSGTRCFRVSLSQKFAREGR